MDDYVERLISSHKLAAKRAAAHLQKTRNLKLQPNEALELIAQISGMNWQTLLGLAKQGRMPENSVLPGASPSEKESFEADSPAPHAAPDVAVLTDEDIVRRLATYYSKVHSVASEHPQFPRSAWRESEDVSLPYWYWVLDSIRAHEGLLPWVRDAMPEYQLARAAHCHVTLAGVGGAWFFQGHHQFSSHEIHLAEEHAYRTGAADIERFVRRVCGGDWTSLAFAEKLRILRRWTCERDADYVPADPDIAREVLLENQAVCNAAGIHLFVNVPEVDRPVTWIADDGDEFRTEAAAYARQASLVYRYVCRMVPLGDNEWIMLPQHRQAKLARLHAKQGRKRSLADAEEKAARAQP